MLISIFLIFFLSIAMVSATNDLSTDDTVSADANPATVNGDLAVGDANPVTGGADLTVENTNQATETAESDVPSESDEILNANTIDEENVKDGETTKKNSSFYACDSVGITDDYIYETIYLHDDEDETIEASIDVSINDEITTIQYTTPFDYKFANLKYGLNNISLIYNGSDFYNPCRYDFTVFRADNYPSLYINASNVYYGNDARITVKILDGKNNIVNGNFNVTIFSSDLDETVIFNRSYQFSNGEGEIIIPAADLTEGRLYYLKLIFPGNELYTSDYTTDDFYVISRDAILYMNDKYYDYYDDDIYYTIGLHNCADDPIDGEVDIYINGRFYDRLVMDDYEKDIYLSGLHEGENKLRVVYNGTDFYNSATKLVKIILYKESVKITSDIPFRTNVLTGEEVSFNASLLSYEDDELINEDFMVTIYAVDDYSIVFSQNYILHNGTGKVTFDTSSLKPGTYRVKIHYDGSVRYGPRTYYAYDEYGDYDLPVIIVAKKRPAELMVEEFLPDIMTEDSFNFTFYLVDSWLFDGSTGEYSKIGGQTINVYLNDVLYGQYITNESTVLKKNISGFISGENIIKFVFNGNDLYDMSQVKMSFSYYPVQSEIKIEGLDRPVEYGKNVTFTVYLIDINSQEYINDNFTLSVYDYYNYYSSDDPIVIAQKNLTKIGLIQLDSSLFTRGRYYIVYLNYDGNERTSPYNLNYVFSIEDDRESLTVKNNYKKISIGEDLVYNVTLSDENGEAIDGEVNVCIYIEGDFYEAKEPIYNRTVNSGELITVEGSLFKDGSYVIRTVFEGNDTYAISVEEDYFVVSSTKLTSIIINVQDIEYREDERILITLVDSNGNVVDRQVLVDVFFADDEWGEPIFSVNVTSGSYFTISGQSLSPNTGYFVRTVHEGNDDMDILITTLIFMFQKPLKELPLLKLTLQKLLLGMTFLSLSLSMMKIMI